MPPQLQRRLPLAVLKHSKRIGFFIDLPEIKLQRRLPLAVLKRHKLLMSVPVHLLLQRRLPLAVLKLIQF